MCRAWLLCPACLVMSSTQTLFCGLMTPHYERLLVILMLPRDVRICGHPRGAPLIALMTMVCAGVPSSASDVQAFAAIRKAKDNF